MERIRLFIFVLLIIFVNKISAQSDTCPANVLLALSRANAACSEIERNEACYGGGDIQVSYYEDMSDVQFAAEGDVAAADIMASVHLNSAVNETWSILDLQGQANLRESQPGRTITMLAFGNVSIENHVEPIPYFTVTAIGNMNIRQFPDKESDIVLTLPLRGTLVTTGRTEDGEWFRVLMPDTDDIGWVSQEIVQANGNILDLDIVDENTPRLRPFEIMSLQTSHDDRWCDRTPESGLLIQTPNLELTDVHVNINGVDLLLRATVFVQAYDGVMTISVLDGQVEVISGEEHRVVPIGARIDIVLTGGNLGEVVPLDATNMVGLPINNLSHRIVIPKPATEKYIAEFLAALLIEETTLPSPTPPPLPRCVYRTKYDVTAWAGPDEYYEIVREISSNTRIYPSVQIVDSEGNTWWQLRDSSWIRATAGEATNACVPLPFAEPAPPPTTNHLIIETCETTNGPIRPGQTVELEFVVTVFHTQSEALEAPSIDPGSVTVNENRLYVRALQPVKVAEERWVRQFVATWVAEPGTYRIVGKRLSYIVSCDITVSG